MRSSLGRMINQNEKKILLLILLFAFLLRLGSSYIILDEMPKSYGWYEIASNVIKGNKTLLQGGYHSSEYDKEIILNFYSARPPIHILFNVMMIYFFKESLFLYILLQSLISTLIVYVSYKLFALTFSKKISILGAAIVCFYPGFVSRVWNASEDNFYLLFILSSIYFLFRFFSKSSLKYLRYSSLFIGLAFLTRTTILTFLVLLVLFIIITQKRSKLILLINTAGIFIITILPLIMYNYSIHKKIALADVGGSRFWIGNNKYIYELFPQTSIDIIEHKMAQDLSKEDYIRLANMSRFEKEDYLLHKAFSFIKENPRSYLLGVFKKFISVFSISYNPRRESKNMPIRQWVHVLTYVPIFLIGIIGFVLYFKVLPLENAVIIIFYLSLMVLAVIFWAHTRHTIPYHFVFIYGTLLYLDQNKTLRKILIERGVES